MGPGLCIHLGKQPADLCTAEVRTTALEQVFHFMRLCVFGKSLDLSEHHLENKGKCCPSELSSQVCFEKAINYYWLMSLKSLNGNYIKYCH